MCNSIDRKCFYILYMYSTSQHWVLWRHHCFVNVRRNISEFSWIYSISKQTSKKKLLWKNLIEFDFRENSFELADMRIMTVFFFLLYNSHLMQIPRIIWSAFTKIYIAFKYYIKKWNEWRVENIAEMFARIQFLNFCITSQVKSHGTFNNYLSFSQMNSTHFQYRRETKKNNI